MLKNRENLIDKFHILFYSPFCFKEYKKYNYMTLNDEAKHYHTSSYNSTLSAR